MEKNPFRAMLALAGRLRRKRGRRPHRPLAVSGPEALERWATAGLVGHGLDVAEYRTAMAEAAAIVDRQPAVAALVWGGKGVRAAEELERLAAGLATRLPELPESTIRAALALNRAGTDSDELIRLLRLTRVQARTIIVAVETR
ncbi:hypothetical protein [Kutzneria sp. CA-103260]|uniref:hypothetical protein n=1 Tax=Kutzneria sp. CA-103260 TaxID=2802641 RepID=UPI001BAD2FD0|nr:hypothetical protein [Kutzneria sp. CA-103260]QUQ64098.1 hypothetical protein JJ691_18180 [Kutzneria sp. CA-103260]